jgi:hypothetical protein
LIAPFENPHIVALQSPEQFHAWLVKDLSLLGLVHVSLSLQKKVRKMKEFAAIESPVLAPHWVAHVHPVGSNG